MTSAGPEEDTAVELPLPRIIQGGMGIGVSGWRLARAVSSSGQLGVVSGTGIDTVLARRLQDGDPGGHHRRAMADFPLPEVAEAALERFYRPDGRAEGEPYDLLSMWRKETPGARKAMNVLAAFVEVRLAREGHDGPVGMNLLTKIQLPNPSALYGAMLAGVDCVIMGAGIPRRIPGVLDRLAEHQRVELPFPEEGVPPGEGDVQVFDPGAYWSTPPPPLRRPRFLPIVSSDTLARVLARKANGRVDGFVVEVPVAGGHNAPPRGGADTSPEGEPVYGPRDEVDLEKIRGLGLPFWLAGGSGRPGGLAAAREQGARGIQAGTLFAYCRESGMADGLKRSVLGAVRDGRANVRTDGRSSPTGYPFKIVEWPDGPSHPAERDRICDMGYLRTAFRSEDGRTRYRCPAEPVETYVKKGGSRDEAAGRSCLCNGLMATIGRGQVRDGGRREPPLVTSGDDLERLDSFLGEREGYSADDVLEYLLNGRTAPR